MGAWSHTSFGNDNAADFIYDVEEQGPDAVVKAIAAIETIAGDGYIESADASVAIAASELLAAANRKPPQDYPEGAQAVVASIAPDAKLRARASAVLGRILARSELQELWQETGDYSLWRADVEGLIERLT